MAVLAKSYPIILVPVVAAYLSARLGRRAAVPLATGLAVVIAGYLPFCERGSEQRGRGGVAVAPPSAEGVEAGPESARPHHPFHGLGTFLARWQMNDLLFMLAHENLRPPGAEPDRWFVLVPGRWREGLHRHALDDLPGAMGLPPGSDPAFLASQALMGLVLLGLCLYWSWRVYRAPEPLALLRACFLTLAWGWLLSSAQHPWYLLWCLPLMVFAGRRSWFLLPGLALLYYLRFWLEYQALGDVFSQDALRAAKARFDYEVVWVEMAPFFLTLLAESVRCRLRRRGQEGGESPVAPCGDGNGPVAA